MSSWLPVKTATLRTATEDTATVITAKGKFGNRNKLQPEETETGRNGNGRMGNQ